MMIKGAMNDDPWGNGIRQPARHLDDVTDNYMAPYEISPTNPLFNSFSKRHPMWQRYRF